MNVLIKSIYIKFLINSSSFRKVEGLSSTNIYAVMGKHTPIPTYVIGAKEWDEFLEKYSI